MDKPVTLEQVIDFLLGAPLFSGLDPAELADVVRIMQVQRVRDGHDVFREGDDGDAWFVVFRGDIVVSKASQFGPQRTVAVLGAHSCFGEMAVLDGSARSASVRVKGDATLFRFPREAFGRLVEEGNQGAYKLVLAMARVLSQRLRGLTQQLSELMTEGVIEDRKVRSSLGPLLDSYTVSE